jgi:anti-sigma B factor antagonist
MDGDLLRVESCAGKRDGQRILRVFGPLTFPTTGVKFLEQVRVETAPVVILDLRGVSSCDSSGIGALMQVYNTFKREDRRLALVGLNERVEAVLGITKVLSFFKVFATVEEAEDMLV